MLFKDSRLKSKFDFGQELPDDMMNLSSLAKEITRITDLIHMMVDNKEVIYFRHTDNNQVPITVDVANIKEKTWDRSINEIEELLFRNDRRKDHTAINKSLRLLGVDEPEFEFDKPEIKRYLQLLYFFYMINYFAFPGINIFKKLSDDSMNFTKLFDEGTENGKYIYFIMMNLLDNRNTLTNFVYFNNLLDKAMNFLFEVLKYFNELDSNDIVCIDDTVEKLEMFEEYLDTFPNGSYHEIGSIDSAVRFCQRYAMQAYCKDISSNLDNPELFCFDEIELPPFEEWKHLYIKVEEIDDFLKDNRLYWFCKQEINLKIECRDRIKFLDSNAVKFFKDFVEYDLNWIKEFEEDGLFVENKNGELIIYALKIAVIIKTYNDLINQKKIKLISGKEIIPLRTTLPIKEKNQGVFASTLPLRLFLLACHSQYLNATCSRERYVQRFVNEYLINEKIFIRLLQQIYEEYNFVGWYSEMLTASREMIEEMKDMI